MTALALAKLRPAEAGKVRCIPNWAENEIVRPTPRAENPLLRELGIADQFVVLYAGNIGKTHGMEVLAEAAAALREDARVHFVVLGFGAKKPWLEQYIATHGLRNVTVLAPRPRSEQIVFLNACDLALISFVPGMAGVSVPSRMYSQMAAGKPIVGVADEESELARVIREEQIGWVVRPGDAGGLVAAIREAAADPARREVMGARAAEAARTKYTFERADRAYQELFDELSPAGRVRGYRSSGK